MQNFVYEQHSLSCLYFQIVTGFNISQYFEVVNFSDPRLASAY